VGSRHVAALAARWLRPRQARDPVDAEKALRVRWRCAGQMYTLTDPRGHRRAGCSAPPGRDRAGAARSQPGLQLPRVAELHAGGVEVRWYPVPRGVLLHAKIGVCSRRAGPRVGELDAEWLGVNHELTSRRATWGRWLRTRRGLPPTGTGAVSG